MRFSSASPLLSAASLLLAPTSAWIVGIQAPATIKTDTDFTITLITADYSQRVYDAAASFGLLATGGPTPSEIEGLGTPFATSVLGDSKSNILTPIELTVNVSSSLEANSGTYYLTASVFSLYGAEASPAARGFNVTVTLGDEVSAETVNSTTPYNF